MYSVRQLSKYTVLALVHSVAPMVDIVTWVVTCNTLATGNKIMNAAQDRLADLMDLPRLIVWTLSAHGE